MILMIFVNRSEKFWEKFIEILFNEVYGTTDTANDYLNLGGWLSDIEAADADVDEMASNVAKNISSSYDDPENTDQFENNKNWLLETIEISYVEADKKFPAIATNII